jgi:hypothetical protein
MDPHLVRLEQRLDQLDDVLRGSTGGSVGLVELVRRMDEAQARHSAELALLRDVPAEIRALREELAAEDGLVRRLSEQTQRLVDAEERRTAIKDGERKALDRVAKWLKIGAGLVALVGVTGSSFGVALLRALSDTVAGLP